MKLLVGCDPEIFLMDDKGKFVSAEGMVPGTKTNPHKVKKGTVQVDGFAAEIGIDPASSATEFADNVETVLQELKSFTGNYQFAFIDSVIFSEKVFEAQSKDGKMLGCEPDYSAYTKMANPVPQPNPPSFRTASGHIHIGWCEGSDITDPGHFADCIAVAKQMDWTVGVPSVGWNPTSRRRALYGKAGAFRPKHYGCEYRTPDNTWLRERKLMEFIFTNTEHGMKQLYTGNHYAGQYNAANYINAPECYGSGEEYLRAMGIPSLKYKADAGKKVATDQKLKKVYIAA